VSALETLHKDLQRPAAAMGHLHAVELPALAAPKCRQQQAAGRCQEGQQEGPPGQSGVLVYCAPGCRPQRWVRAASAVGGPAVGLLRGFLAVAGGLLLRHTRCHQAVGRSAPPKESVVLLLLMMLVLGLSRHMPADKQGKRSNKAGGICMVGI